MKTSINLHDFIVSENTHKSIVKKQSELFNIEGRKRTLAEIVEKSISKGIDLIDIRVKD